MKSKYNKCCSFIHDCSKTKDDLGETTVPVSLQPYGPDYQD